MKRILAATETVAALFLLAIALLTAGNVVLRDLLGIQIPDWFDGSKLLMSIALFWGIAVTTYHAGHICVDVVWERLSAAGRLGLDALASMLTLAFLAPMAWMVWAKVATVGTQVTTDLRLPIVGFYALAAAGALAAVVLAALRAWNLARGHAPHADADAGDAHGS